MKANELMLGDWVLCDGKPYQVAEISAGLLCIDAERELFADPEDIQPIPITPEILEKNGWGWDGVYAMLQYDESAYLSYYKHEGILRDYRDVREGVDLIFLSRPGLNSVHELQHALRLCGIERNIVI